MPNDNRRVTTLEERVSELENHLALRHSAVGGFRRRHTTSAAVVLIAVLAMLPAMALAGHQLGDVPTGHPFHGDIDVIADAGVTSGCGSGNYCPDRNVTRAEMAAFMNRLGALGAGKQPVVNADRIDGLDSSALLRTNSRGVAIAGVRVSPGGVVHSWFNRAGGKPTVTDTGTGTYQVAVPGRTFDDHGDFVASASLFGGLPGSAVLECCISGDVLVWTFDSDGGAADRAFDLVVFDASPSG